MLAIDINSAHYKYYTWVRRMYGATDLKDQTSLCPYCQTILWGSIFCIVLFPVVILGWIFMKTGRWSCKIEHRHVDSILNFLKEKTTWIEDLDEGPNNFSKSPIAAGILYFISGTTIVFLVALGIGFVACMFGLLGLGVWNITSVAYHVLLAFSYVGWAGFMALYYVGFALQYIFEWTIWLFANGPLWYLIGSWALWALIVILIAGSVSVGICLVAKWVASMPPVKRFGLWLVTTFNGFSEAMERRAERAKKIKEEKPDRPPWTCLYCSYDNNPVVRMTCRECHQNRTFEESALSKMFFWFFRVLFSPFKVVGDTYIKNKDKPLFVLSTGLVFWEWIWAIKKGVCPIVEFVDSRKLRAQALVSAQARMKAEEVVEDGDPHDIGGEG